MNTQRFLEMGFFFEVLRPGFFLKKALNLDNRAFCRSSRFFASLGKTLSKASDRPTSFDQTPAIFSVASMRSRRGSGGSDPSSSQPWPRTVEAR